MKTKNLIYIPLENQSTELCQEVKILAKKSGCFAKAFYGICFNKQTSYPVAVFEIYAEREDFLDFMEVVAEHCETPLLATLQDAERIEDFSYAKVCTAIVGVGNSSEMIYDAWKRLQPSVSRIKTGESIEILLYKHENRVMLQAIATQDVKNILAWQQFLGEALRKAAVSQPVFSNTFVKVFEKK